MKASNDVGLDEKAMIQENPIRMVEYEFLTIKTKASSLKVFQLNTVQKIILAIIKKIQKEGRPVRLIILKARQTGVSTLIEALFYAYTSQGEGINSLVMADDVKGANYIFEMQKLFHEKLPEHLKPRIKHSNEKKLEFDSIHSQVLIDTAENLNAGKKFTLRYCHLTEASIYKDLDTIMMGLSQSVPAANNTMIVIESTANGMGNSYQKRWEEAKKGKSDWVGIFIPWFELPEYRLPLPADNEFYPIDNLKYDKLKFLKEEKELRLKFNLDDAQINWRRWCIINNCNGEVSGFAQDYPATDLEAFIMSGNLFFDKESLLAQDNRAAAAKLKGRPKTGEIVLQEGKHIFRECEEGRFRMYEHPDPDAFYCVGADSAEGLAHGDDSAAVVLNKKTNKVACAYNCKCDGDEFAVDLRKMGMFFNEAMVAPENKSYGTAVCRKLYKSYGNIFRKVLDKTGSMDVTDELGWNTNASTRPQMLAQLKEELREGAITVLDGEILAQLRTFINNTEKKRPEAASGEKDDLVFALAIAVMVRMYYPFISRKSIQAARDNSIYGKPLPVNQGIGFKQE